VRSALDENHLAAKATNGLRHLYAERPVSEHEQCSLGELPPTTMTS
jgi:hypothetical protein